MSTSSPSKYASLHGSTGKMRAYGDKSVGSPAKKSTSAKCKVAKNAKTPGKTLASSDDFEQDYAEDPDFASPNEKKHRLIKQPKSDAKKNIVI